jgi:hypothetical protein
MHRKLPDPVLIRIALVATQGNVTNAASALCCSRVTLHRELKRHGLAEVAKQIRNSRERSSFDVGRAQAQIRLAQDRLSRS